MTGKDPATLVEELAGGCVAAVQNSLGIELDFTPDTLPILDHYVRQLEDPTEEMLGLLAPMCGAYFGEVARRQMPGARWHVEEDYTRWRVELEPVFLWWNPVGVALEVLLEEEAPGYFAHASMENEDRRVVEDALARLGEVEAEDYFRFTMRYEVLELAYATLTALRTERRDRSEGYGPEHYAAAVPPPPKDEDLS